MLIDNKYRLNRNGEIIKREIVAVQCDKCGKTWQTAYSNRKRKTLEVDLCVRCRAKNRNSGKANGSMQRRSSPSKSEITCSVCEKKFHRRQAAIKNINFCSIKCRDDYTFKHKYGHLLEAFNRNTDEVAYLVGLILGDGHLKKISDRTIRVSIAFDFTGKWGELMRDAKKVLTKLEINWFEEPKVRTSCKMIGFILPNEVLASIGILYSGNKYSANPCPDKNIEKNINYASGLINSDGCYRKTARCEQYFFANTVRSIAESLSRCLNENGIKNSIYQYPGLLDKRTNNVNKQRNVIYIGGKNNIFLLHKLSKFTIKGEISCKHTKAKKIQK